MSPRVLVADDSPTVRAMVRRELENAGFEVVEAADGVEAAVLVFSRMPDVVVTDLEMPLMSGTQLARLLRDDPATHDIPIVVLTGHDEAPRRFWSLHTGADRFVPKGDGFAGLVEAVQELVEEDRDRPHPRPGPSERGVTAVEILARVARRLDDRLLEATLVAMLLRRGAGAGSVTEAARATFEVLSSVLDVHAMALVLRGADRAPRGVVWLEGRGEASEAVAGKLVTAAAAAVGIECPAPEEVVTIVAAGTGEGPGAGDVEPLYPLRLQGGRLSGVLAVVPVRPEEFDETGSRLLGALSPHISLVLDNAHLAERLVELSTMDDLTGVLNHRAILERLQAEVARGRRYGGGVAVILADLDHFKTVNDTYGHLAGDAVLQAVASTLREGLRLVDAVGRYGGEEFLMVLPVTPLEEARRAAERLRAAVASRSVPADGREIRITASFGVAADHELDRPEAEDLIRLADDRLYRAKKEGRDRVCP